MKKITTWLVLTIFVASIDAYSQTNNQLTDTDQLKIELMQINEAVPGFTPGEVQYTDDDWDLQFEYPCAVASSEAGVETDGSYIYTTLWNGTKFCKHEMDGTFVETFGCGSAAAVRDLAYDGIYSYGMAADMSANIGPRGEGDWLEVAPLSGTVTRGSSEMIALDFDATDLYAGDYLADLTIDNNSPTAQVMVDVTLTVGGTVIIDPPTNFDAVHVPPISAYLTWEYDIPEGQWLSYHDGTNKDGIGLTGGGSFMSAIRWDADDLTPYDGYALTKINFFPRNDVGTGTAAFVLKVWTGANASNLIYEQTLASVTFDEWNEIMLDTPQVVDARDELWVGYSVDYPAGDSPAGVAPGPAVAGYGDMITLDGGKSWDSMSIVYSLDYNWNLDVYVMPPTEGMEFAEPTVISHEPIANNNTEIALGKLTPAANPKVANERRWLGFNIYRDGEVIEYTTDLEYTDAGLAPGEYLYDVTAVWDEGESTGAGELIVIIPGPPDIVVNPIKFPFSLSPYPTETQIMEVHNYGMETLNYTLDIVYRDNAASTPVPQERPANFDASNSEANPVLWLTCDPMSGSVDGNAMEPVDVICNADGLGTDEYYYATIMVESNDPGTPLVEVSVTLDVLDAISEYEDAYIMMYPNPAKTSVNISTNYELSTVTIINQLGQVVFDQQVKGSSAQVNTSQLQKGIYFVKINCVAGESTQKLIIQ